VGFWLVLLALAAGVANSIYLLYSHIQHKRGGDIAGLCDISVTLNCRGAIESDWSTLFNVPVPVWAIAFYATLLFGALRLGPPKRTPPATGWALIGGGVLLGTLYSFFLLYLLVFEIQVACPGCLVLDAANVVALVGFFLLVGQGLGGGLRWLVRSLPREALGRSGMAAAVAFAAVFFITALVAREQLRIDTPPDVPVPPDRAYNIVEGFPGRVTRVEVAHADGAPVKGDPDAPVVIVEFSDFECPYCRRHADVLAALVEAHPERVQVRFMHYPLNSECNPHLESRGHTGACRAARASVCAQDQGRFWEMHDLLFANSQHLDRRSILDMARSLRVDPDEFEACLDSDYSLERVRQQAIAGMAAAREAGAGQLGTPFSFVNGLLVRGAQPRAALEALILRESPGDEGADGPGEEAAAAGERP
jgi:protein-disulfide isomerase/uncharacterized membrane protein